MCINGGIRCQRTKMTVLISRRYLYRYSPVLGVARFSSHLFDSI